MDEFLPILLKASVLLGDLRSIVVSDEQGIHARIGKMKSDPEGSTVIQAYLFKRDLWTVEAAQRWVEETKRATGGDGPQRRYISNEVRLNFDSGPPKIQGYAARFDQITELWPGFRERVKRGAFTETIQQDDVRALWNHDPNFVLGRNVAKTLELFEDDKGLGYRIIPPDTSAAKDLMVSIKRGDVSQSSFGFNIIKRTIEIDEEKDEMLRTIEKVQLFDVSPVTFPAYPQTEVHVRMTTNEKERIYFVGDEVITVPVPLDAVQAREVDEDYFKRFEDLKGKVFPKTIGP